jgi:hypothetical protein
MDSWSNQIQVLVLSELNLISKRDEALTYSNELDEDLGSHEAEQSKAKYEPAIRRFWMIHEIVSNEW